LKEKSSDDNIKDFTSIFSLRKDEQKRKVGVLTRPLKSHKEMIDPELIVMPGFSPRPAIDEKHILELEESLEKDGGQRSKILCAYRGEKGKEAEIRLIDGGHLVKAAIRKKIDKVEVTVYDDASDEECYALALRFDAINMPFDSLAKARTLKLLMDEYHWTVADIMKHTPLRSRSEQYIYDLLGLLKLDSQIQKEIEQPGSLVKNPKTTLTPSHGRELVKLPLKDQLPIAKQILQYGVSVHDAQQLVAQRKDELLAGVTLEDVKVVHQAIKKGKTFRDFDKAVVEPTRRSGTLVNVVKLSFWRLLVEVNPKLYDVKLIVPKPPLVAALRKDLTRLDSH